MSAIRRLLLTGKQPLQIPAPPDGGGGGPIDPGPTNPLYPGWPATTDTFLESIRPKGRRIITTSVGIPGAAYTTVAAAATAAANAVNADGLDGGLYWDGAGPDYRNDVLIGPAIYNEEGGGGQWNCYVGTSGDPTNTVLQFGGDSGGTLHTFGSIYLENLTIKAYSVDGDVSPKYPWHITGGPITIAANCIFDVRGAVSGVSAVGGNRTAGLVGKDSSVLTIFYKCKFIGDPAAGITGFNMHGGSTPGRWPETCIFLDCETENISGIGSTGNLSLTGERSKLYVINLTHDGLLGEISSDANTDVFTNTSLALTGGTTITYGVNEPPALVNGMLPELDAFFYPSAIGEQGDQSVTVTDAAPMSPVANRQYYVKIRLTEAQRIQVAGYVCSFADGNYGISLEPVDTPYELDKLPSLDLLGTSVPLALGRVASQHYYAYTRYPGDNGIWVKVRFNSATAQIMGSAQLPGLTDCFYTDDGVSLNAVTAGTPHPLLFIAPKA